MSTFFCEGHLEDIPLTNQSSDKRYCSRCCEFLEHEAELIEGKRKPDWIPTTFRPKPQPAPTMPSASVSEPNLGGNNTDVSVNIPAKTKEVLLHSKTTTRHAYQNPTEDRPKVNVGGRPRKDIPVSAIRQLHKRGYSIKAIVKELSAQGYKLSAMTIQRVLSGQREVIAYSPKP